MQVLSVSSLLFFACLVTPFVAPAPVDDALSEALAAVRAVDVNGLGHESAVKAMKVINMASVEQIPQILMGMDGANRLAVNWIRGGVLSIVGRGGELPRATIEEYLKDTSHGQLGRLLAFELLTDGNQELARQMIPGFIDDPSLPLREKAVDALIEIAKTETDSVQKIGNLAFALEKARDINQVQQIAKLLDSNGVVINLQKQLGFLNTWNIVGSFDNKGQAGFEVAYGPEKELKKIDLKATYKDALTEPAKWSRQTTGEETGIVNLNELIGPVKGATVYAVATFEAEEGRQVQIRLGTPNATKVWVNGELVMDNEVYHNSNPMDKFVGSALFKEGKNEILIKVCQNEQTDSWAQVWEFQLRVCDETGKAIKPVTPPPAEQ